MSHTLQNEQANSKIQGKFYPLQHEEWLSTYKELTPAQLAVLYYVRTIDPDNNGIALSAAQIARDLSSLDRVVHRQTVSRALKVLGKLGYLPEWFGMKIVQADDRERQIRDRLKTELNGETEVATVVGRIDLLTNSEVIEIKEIRSWKEALGKILAYSAIFPEHIKRIHLFGYTDLAKLTLAQATCSEFGVIVTFEETC